AAPAFFLAEKPSDLQLRDPIIGAAERLQDRVPSVRRVAHREAARRRAVDAALLQIGDRLRALAQCRSIDLIRLAHQRVEIVVLAAALVGPSSVAVAGHFHAELLGERLDGLGIAQVVVRHQEADRAAVLAAAEAVIRAPGWAHRERRRLLGVKGAEALECATGFLERNARADDLCDVRMCEQLVDEGLWDPAAHGPALCEPGTRPQARLSFGSREVEGVGYSGVSIARTRGPTALMSTRPAARDLMTPMTLPRSLTLCALAASIASAISVSSSASLSGCGR